MGEVSDDPRLPILVCPLMLCTTQMGGKGQMTLGLRSTDNPSDTFIR